MSLSMWLASTTLFWEMTSTLFLLTLCRKEFSKLMACCASSRTLLWSLPKESSLVRVTLFEVVSLSLVNLFRVDYEKKQ